MFTYILDRENRHVLGVYYLPTTHNIQKKIYSHERSSSGGYLQAKDFDGNLIYKNVHLSQPHLSHYQFWMPRFVPQKLHFYFSPL